MKAAPVSLFQRILLALMVMLYLISLGLFTYGNWMAEGEPHQLWMHAVNALILSIPLVLFYGSIYVLANAWREHHQTGEINPRLARIIHLAPRIAAVLIIFFVSLFSLDVFDMEGTPLQLAGAFLIHSLPSIAMTVLLVIAWKRPVVGFIAFLVAGIVFLRFVVLGGDVLHLLLFSGPLLLISALFYVDWRWQKMRPPVDAVL